ncbi:MAG: hypothetical protein ICV79_13870 [Flavisolibacter sp.]|nr:hypothetical protein [Flavisolibacter sp.]
MSKLIDLQQWLQQNEAQEKQEAKLFLTEKEVRSLPKFKQASDVEIQNIITTLHHLALISYQLFCKEEQQNLTKAA